MGKSEKNRVSAIVAELVAARWGETHGAQTAAAEALGLKLPQLNRILTGSRPPSREMLGTLADALAVPVDKLLGLTVDVVGVASAGGGVDYPTPTEYLAVASLYPAGTVAYRVEGDSMRDQGILDHDYLLVRADPLPATGEVVVVYVPDVGTVVKLKRAKGYDSANDDSPREQIACVPGCREFGVYVGIVRKYQGPRKGKRRAYNPA